MYQTRLDKRSLRSALLLGAASVAAAGLSIPASAQENVETVVVTGSRIPQTGLYSTSPVTAVGQQELKFEGTNSVETLLNNLPSVFTDQNSTVTNGATGTATVNLRGLGCARTLVLVNGRRLMPGDPAVPCADLNDIPAAMVDHVEVLTGGASAVYGSDAVAGVVNFIMRKDFEGIELDGQWSVDNNSNDNGFVRGLQSAVGFAQAKENIWDGESKNGTLLMGVNTGDGKGNVTAYLNYAQTPGIYSGARDYSACALSPVRNADGVVTTLRCAGSANGNYWVSIDNYVFGNPYSFFQEGTGKTGSGKLVPFTGAPNQYFNYGPLQYLQRPDTRYTGGFFAHYDVNPALEMYSEFMFTDDKSTAALAPSAQFAGTGPVSGAFNETNCDNPFMTVQENQILCGLNPGDNLITSGNIVDALGHPYYDGSGNIYPGQALVEIGRRFVEAGHRFFTTEHTSYRMVVGAKGDLGGGWSYDVYGQYGYTSFQEHDTGQVSVTRVQQGLEVDPLTGQCIGLEQNPPQAQAGCVGLDFFNGYGSLNKQMLGFASVAGLVQGYTQEQVVSGSITGDLGQYGIQSPWAKNPVAVSLGAEYRAEYLERDPDQLEQSGDLSGTGVITAQPKAGYNVTEGFGEIRVPLVQGMPWVEDLSLNGGYRYSSYSVAGTTSAYKYGAEWQPIDDFRIRLGYNRAVRAPNVIELFTPAAIGLFSGDDPCSKNGAAGQGDQKVIANCIAEGVPANLVGSALLNCTASQCNGFFGGNLNLRPETSDTRTLGVVFTPTFFDGFTATVDYFNIAVHGFIGPIPPTTVLAECYGDQANSATQAFFCPFVHRSAATHAITGNGFVTATSTNTGYLRTKGIDVNANYNVDLGDWGFANSGSLAFSLVGTWLQTLTTDPFPGLPKYGCAGLYGPTCGTPNPRWRHSLRVTWSSPWDFDLSLNWRYYGGVELDTQTPNAVLHGGPDVYDRTIPAYNWFDLAGTYNVREGVQLRAGVNNIFDKEPPILASAVTPLPVGNGNSFPGVYDGLGRVVFIGATIKY